MAINATPMRAAIQSLGASLPEPELQMRPCPLIRAYQIAIRIPCADGAAIGRIKVPRLHVAAIGSRRVGGRPLGRTSCDGTDSQDIGQCGAEHKITPLWTVRSGTYWTVNRAPSSPAREVTPR